jgi:hypothetical protein
VSWNKIGDTLCTGGSDGLVRQWKLAGAHSTVTLRLAKVQSRCHIWAIAVLAYRPPPPHASHGALALSIGFDT